VTSSGYAYRYIVDRADLIIVLGASFNERTSYLWDEKLLQHKKIVQIDSDYDQLEKVFTVDVAIHGDIREILSEALTVIQNRAIHNSRATVIREDIRALKGTANSSYAIFQSGFSVVEHLFSRLGECFPKDAVIFDDNIIFAQNFFNVSSGNHYYPNSGISSLGHAIPAAIGARFSNDKATFAILGDGGFQMCCMEIMTAVNYGKPLNIILFNNSTMGLIRKNQHQHYNERFINCDFINPDFNFLAQSFGINYSRIVTEADVDALFTSCDLRHAINLIEVVIDKDRYPNYSSRR
jgi:acetolactate synthase-1/2/3 large subunit